jgi:hypothetical protein
VVYHQSALENSLRKKTKLKKNNVCLGMRPFFFNIDTIVWKVNITDRKNFFSLLLSQKNMQVLFRFFSEAWEKKTCNKSHTHIYSVFSLFNFKA